MKFQNHYLNMKSPTWKLLTIFYSACLFYSAFRGVAGLESNLDENKLRLIRDRRDVSVVGLDSSSDGSESINENPSNEYNALYEYPSLSGMESPISEKSVSEEGKITKDENEEISPYSYFEGNLNEIQNLYHGWICFDTYYLIILLDGELFVNRMLTLNQTMSLT